METLQEAWKPGKGKPVCAPALPGDICGHTENRGLQGVQVHAKGFGWVLVTQRVPYNKPGTEAHICCLCWLRWALQQMITHTQLHTKAKPHSCLCWLHGCVEAAGQHWV